jgi:CRISPR-associated protein Csd2
MAWKDHIPNDIANLYEVHDFRHAAAILATEFPEEFHEVCEALRAFRFTKEDVIIGGGNESNIPKNFSNILRSMGWKQKILNGKIMVNDTIFRNDNSKIDYIKGEIAFDIQYTGKIKAFDRALKTFRTFYDYRKISLGIFLTKDNNFDLYFYELDYSIENKESKNKRGKRIPYMKQILTRLKSGQNGGCPILVFRITPNILE